MFSEFTKQLLNNSNGFDFVAAHFACEKDKFSESNPNGFVNLGSAQNLLGKTAIQSRLKALDWNPEDTPCLLYTSPSPRDATLSRMPSSA